MTPADTPAAPPTVPAREQVERLIANLRARAERAEAALARLFDTPPEEP